MIEVQTEADWRQRADKMREAIVTIDTLIKTAPQVPFEEGKRYRVVLMAQAVADWPPQLGKMDEAIAYQDTTLLEGVFRGWIEPVPGQRNAVLYLPDLDKTAVFTCTDVLRYEAVEG